MKFEAEDPAEVSKNDKQGGVDRSQGAARAISVSGRYELNVVSQKTSLNLLHLSCSPSLILDCNGAT